MQLEEIFLVKEINKGKITIVKAISTGETLIQKAEAIPLRHYNT